MRKTNQKGDRKERMSINREGKTTTTTKKIEGVVKQTDKVEQALTTEQEGRFAAINERTMK